MVPAGTGPFQSATLISTSFIKSPLARLWVATITLLLGATLLAANWAEISRYSTALAAPETTSANKTTNTRRCFTELAP